MAPSIANISKATDVKDILLEGDEVLYSIRCSEVLEIPERFLGKVGNQKYRITAKKSGEIRICQ